MYLKIWIPDVAVHNALRVASSLGFVQFANCKEMVALSSPEIERKPSCSAFLCAALGPDFG